MVGCIARRSGDSDTSSGGPKQQRRHPRPLARHLGISLATCLLLFAAFLLFLLVGLSLPIIRTVYLFDVRFATAPGAPATSVATDLRFGVWGVCARSAVGTSECFGPALGYAVPASLLDLTGYPGLAQGVLDGVLAVLVLHLVAAALSALGMLAALFLESHAACIASLVVSVFTVLVGAAVFAVDLVVVIVGKQRIPGLTDFNYTVNWGPAIWMVLAAVVLAFLGMVLMSVVVCECCGVGRRHHHRHHRSSGKGGPGEKC